MTDELALNAEAERIRASGVLGEARVRRLFDYLVGTSVAGQSPKEISLAMDVFGKGPDFDVSQDALVRVYVHKLRRGLEEFYNAHGSGTGGVLQLPRGEYRLRWAPAPATEAPQGGEGPPARALRGRVAPWQRAAALVLAALVGFAAAWLLREPRSGVATVRNHPVWDSLLRDDRPILIVLGDYYLIGETDRSMEVRRLVREYDVNSKSDLDKYLQQHPELLDRYTDLGLRYLPTAAAYALRDVMTVLAPQTRRVTVSMMSDLKASSLKSADIIYIGYLSGLGKMQELTFEGSRFAVGQSFDEIIDKQTRRTYISQTAAQIFTSAQDHGTDSPYRDYGYFASFRGPGGNHIIVIAGTRDEGVRQTSEVVTNPDKLRELGGAAPSSRPMEALLQVSAFDGVNLGGQVLAQSPRNFLPRK